MGASFLWEKALKILSEQNQKPNLSTWLKTIKPKAIKDNKFILLVPNLFTRDWLEKKFKSLLLETVRNIEPSIRTIEFSVIRKTLNSSKLKKREIKQKGIEIQLGLIDIDIDPETNLNAKYNFDNFVVGDFNEMAYACASSLRNIEFLGKEYNPLFIYGDVGLGKTHIIQAVGNDLIKKYKRKIKILYTTGELFSNDLIEAVKKQKIEEFHKKYRTVDLLIIDDVQFLSGREKTQIEFFHTFNYLYGLNKQIIISSDRAPSAIPALHNRLLSRFEGGTVADITYPDYESRLAILKIKSTHYSISIPEEVLEYIAANIQKSIRQLEGALNKIVLNIKTKNTIPSLNETKKILKQFVYAPKKRVNPSKIIESVAEYYGIDVDTLINGGRQKEYVRPRHICMYLLREELKESFTLIGKRFGGKDHTTVIHGYEKIIKELKENPELEQEIYNIKQKIYL